METVCEREDQKPVPPTPLPKKKKEKMSEKKRRQNQTWGGEISVQQADERERNSTCVEVEKGKIFKLNMVSCQI